MGYTVNRTYIAPITTTGAPVAPSSESTFQNARGVFTLAANTTYYFVLPVGGSTLFDLHLTHDAAIIITSAMIETCSHGRSDVSDYSTVGGEWIGQDLAAAVVPTEGANTSATSGVVAVTGGVAGGADWQVSEMSAARGRLKVVVGATGGEVRVSFCGKE